MNEAIFQFEVRASSRSIKGRIPYEALSVPMGMGSWREKLAPGCFADSLRSGSQIMSYWGHDVNQPLGNSIAGTLKLTDSRTALEFEIIPPSSAWGASALEAVKRGDVRHCSFGFSCESQRWEKINNEDVRTVERARLIEVSPTSQPAYPSTVVRSTRGDQMINLTLKDFYFKRQALLSEMRALSDSPNFDKEKYDRMEANFDALTRKIELEKRELAAFGGVEDKGDFKPNPGQYNRDVEAHEEERRNPRDSWGGKTMRILRPGEKREAAKPTDIEERDLQRYYTVGLAGLDESEKKRFELRRTLQADKDVVGGFLVLPEVFSDQMLTELNDELFIRALATKIELKYAGSFAVPYESNAGDESSWTAEIKSGHEDATMQWEKRALTPKPSAKRVIFSRTLAQRARGFVAYANSRIAYKFNITEERAFLTGDGGGRPMGLFTAAASGSLGIPTSRDVSTGNTATEIKADNLIECLMTLKAQYRKNSVWIFHRDAIKQIRKLKDGQGNYLLQVGISADKPDTILGKKFYESEYCPSTFTTGQYVGLVGDLSYYWICTALPIEIRLLEELYAESNSLGLIGRMEVDGAPILESAFVRVKLG